MIRALTLVLLSLLVLAAATYLTPLSYLYCLARERAWLAARTEPELERRLFGLYSKRVIAPSESPWGRDYRLGRGEHMVQYLVLWKEPLDVVLDDQGRVVTAFTSYE